MHDLERTETAREAAIGDAIYGAHASLADERLHFVTVADDVAGGEEIGHEMKSTPMVVVCQGEACLREA